MKQKFLILFAFEPCPQSAMYRTVEHRIHVTLSSFNNGHSMYPPVTSPHEDIQSTALRRANCYTETLGEWGIR
jgi:hypothetical protein